MKRLVLGLFCIAALVGVPSGALATNSRSATPIAYTTVGPPLPPVAPAKELASILADLPPSTFVDAEIGVPPPERHQSWPLWLYVTVNISSQSGETNMEAKWKGDLLTGAVAERAGTSDAIADDFRGGTIWGRLPNGKTIELSSFGIHGTERGQIFSKKSDDAIGTAILGTLEKYSLTPVDIKILDAPTGAPIVVARTMHPAAALTRRMKIMDELFGTQLHRKYPGFYFELEDWAGRSIFQTSAEFRVGVGSAYFAPAYVRFMGDGGVYDLPYCTGVVKSTNEHPCIEG